MEAHSSWQPFGELLSDHLEELFVTEGEEEREIEELYCALPEPILSSMVAAVRVREPRDDPGLWVLAGDREGKPRHILGRIVPGKAGVGREALSVGKGPSSPTPNAQRPTPTPGAQRP
jgi:hypothetical protein